MLHAGLLPPFVSSQVITALFVGAALFLAELTCSHMWSFTANIPADALRHSRVAYLRRKKATRVLLQKTALFSSWWTIMA